MVSEQAAAVGWRWRWAAALTLRFVLLGLLVLGAAEAARTPGYPVSALAALLAALAVACELVHHLRRGERRLAAALDALTRGERAPRQVTPEPALAARIAAMDQRLQKERNEQHARLLMLQAQLDHSPAPLLRLLEPAAGSAAAAGAGVVVEPLNNAARRLVAGLRAGPRPHAAAIGADFERLLSQHPVDGPLQNQHASRIITIELRGLPQRCAVSVAALTSPEGPMRIVALQDVHSGVEAAQAQMWRDLVRVLRHEIMNAMVPITSLAHSALRLLDDAGGPAAAQADARRAIATLAQRAEGLSRFVDAYRELTRPLLLTLAPLDLAALLDGVSQSLQAEWPQTLHCSTQMEPALPPLRADRALLQHALAALARNAAEAAIEQRAADAQVRLAARLHDGRVWISVDDNGPGIALEQRDEVLLPFYTTKAQGTGVGLSLAQQVVLAHGGRLSIGDSPLGGARVTLVLDAGGE